TCALVFAASAAATFAWCGSMAAMDGMPMSGGWTMSMAWMRMPGETWAEAAATFTGMWTVMTIAMMLPALVPMLMRYRAAAGGPGRGRPHAKLLLHASLAMTAGYFTTWTLLGVA